MMMRRKLLMQNDLAARSILVSSYELAGDPRLSRGRVPLANPGGAGGRVPRLSPSQ